MNINLTNANATNKKISELYRSIKSGELILQPAFQRNFVWNTNHRKQFIETILEGLPFPEIYIADQGVDLEALASQEVVVDGQQRLTTIIQYIDGVLKIGANDSIKPYKDNPKDIQKKFLNYKVTVRQLEGVDKATIKEIFRRINLTKYALNNYEIHNAIYDGGFITLAKELATSKEVIDLPTFSEVSDVRMQDLGFMLLLMSTLEMGGYFNGDKEIESFVKKYNDEFPGRENLKRRIKQIFKQIKSLDLDVDSLWFKRSNLFTLFVVLASIQVPEGLRNKLTDFETKLIQNKDIDNKDKNDFSLYYFYTVAGTSSRNARVTRDKILRKYLEK